MELKNASALVTGGASGLGEATVRHLHSLGMAVVIADRNTDRGRTLERELGGGARFVETDVSSESAVTAAVEAASEAGPLRLAVSCAGVGWASRVVDKQGIPHDLEMFRLILTVNLLGTFNVLRLAAAAMARNAPEASGDRGVVVNTASVAAFDGQIGQIAYAASKGGVVGLTLPAARDLSAVGVRVVTIAPGVFDTPILGPLPEEMKQAIGGAVPYPRRMGNPHEYAILVEHIARNGYLNGETIRLDGALRMPPR